MKATDMSTFWAKHLLLLLLLPWMATVDAKDLSNYPCTVFSADVCFRLPAGTHVDYSVPADFDLYRVSKNAQPIATIYIGNSPQMVETSVVPSVSETTSGTIKIYRDVATPAETLDVYITPKGADAPTIHISADLKPSTYNEFIELLSSFRPCKPIRSGGQQCPLNAAWSRELAALMP